MKLYFGKPQHKAGDVVPCSCDNCGYRGEAKIAAVLSYHCGEIVYSLGTYSCPICGRHNLEIGEPDLDIREFSREEVLVEMLTED